MSLLNDFLTKNASYVATADERRAIPTFERLAPNPKWRPDNPHLGGYYKVIEIGLLANILEGSENSERLVRKCISEYIEGASSFSSSLGELNVGAVLRKLYQDIRYQKELQESRTSDIIVVEGEQTCLEIEIAFAEKKRGHDQYIAEMTTLVDAVGIRSDGNYAIFVVPPLGQTKSLEICNAINSTPVGQSASSPGSWHVAVGTVAQRDDFTGGAGLKKFEPQWWNDGPNFQITTTCMGGTFQNAPIMTMVSAVPIENYLNPSKRKAEFPQCTGNFPYVIALDVSHFPDAHKRIRGDILQWLDLWEDVSAVFLVQPRVFLFGQSIWRCSLLKNNHAARPLPANFLAEVDEWGVDISFGR